LKLKIVPTTAADRHETGTWNHEHRHNVLKHNFQGIVILIVLIGLGTKIEGEKKYGFYLQIFNGW